MSLLSTKAAPSTIPVGYIPAKEAADLMSLKTIKSVNWVYALQENRLQRGYMSVGKVPFVRNGRRVYYKESDIGNLSDEFNAAKFAGRKLCRIFP